VLAQPGDARLVDVSPPELGDLGLAEKMAEGATSPAPEIENPPALEAPLGWKHRDDLIARSATASLVPLHRLVQVRYRAHPICKVERWCGDPAGHGAPIIGPAR